MNEELLNGTTVMFLILVFYYHSRIVGLSEKKALNNVLIYFVLLFLTALFPLMFSIFL